MSRRVRFADDPIVTGRDTKAVSGSYVAYDKDNVPIPVEIMLVVGGKVSTAWDEEEFDVRELDCPYDVLIRSADTGWSYACVHDLFIDCDAHGRMVISHRWNKTKCNWEGGACPWQPYIIFYEGYCCTSSKFTIKMDI